MEITKLYQDFILKRSQDDNNFEKRPTAQHTLEAYNPMCGDKFKLFLDVENDIISKATFHGYGCAISKAATSVLIEKLQNKTYFEAQNLINSYFQVLNVENTEGVTLDSNSLQIDQEIKAFEIMKQFPERMTCATLSWQAALDFLSIKKV
jgi:nitrogen fixation protein NifU and related proteins